MRVEFNITNFEPCRGTPLADADQVDFAEKEKFLEVWTKALQEHGFRSGSKSITYSNGRGRLGRRQESYDLLMQLKTRGSEITPALVSSFKNGVGRSIKPELARAFVEKCRALRKGEQ